jgi:CheY-like chemotaxis protein
MAVKIAVVDHDPVYLKLIERVLRQAEFDPILCPSGTAAHETIAEAQPGVVLIDTWLDTRDAGWLLIQTLQLDERTRRIPLVVSSSDVDEVERQLERAEQLGNIHLLAKPFAPELLLEKIALAVKTRPLQV